MHYSSRKKYREAMKAYIVAGDRAGVELEAAIKFNLANLYLDYASSLGDASDLTVPLIELAKENYRDLLRTDSRDWDTKYNLEFALAMLPEPEELKVDEELMPEHSRRSLAVRDIEEHLP